MERRVFLVLLGAAGAILPAPGKPRTPPERTGSRPGPLPRVYFTEGGPMPGPRPRSTAITYLEP